MMRNPTDLAFIDTNVLVYAQQRKSARHQTAKSLRDRALNGVIAACVSPQVLSEFFVTITRTDKRAIEEPLSPEEAVDELRRYCESDQLTLIHPGPRIMERTFWLLARYPVQGLRFHDVRHVATMLENNVTRIYTFNTPHFSQFAEIEVLDPSELAVTEPAPEEEPEGQDKDNGQPPP